MAKETFTNKQEVEQNGNIVILRTISTNTIELESEEQAAQFAELHAQLTEEQEKLSDLTRQQNDVYENLSRLQEEVYKLVGDEDEELEECSCGGHCHG